MSGPFAAVLPDGRLHLQHGPIDLIIGADDPQPAYRAARARFATILEELVDELPTLRTARGARPSGTTARRMYAAVHGHDNFVTPMAAVAGAVADEVLAAMRAATPLTRAYVNNGGDIALHLSGQARFRLAMAAPDGTALGTIDIRAGDRVGGIATSGQGGRSLSRGIADAVTVLAPSAAEADAAATLIANAVDVDDPAIRRVPASSQDPDSDLGARLVVTKVPALPPDLAALALDRGARRAAALVAARRILAAALFLQGQSRSVALPALEPRKSLEHA